jgi:hypothetical protein
MNKWLKHLQPMGGKMAQKLTGYGVALGLAAALIVPSELSAAPAFGFDDYSRPAASGHVRNDLLLIHCCHSHPYPPYDRYCCHERGYARPGAPVARAAVGAAVTYGAYRGVRSATKSAYKRGHSSAKKHYKSRRR